jgi:hypothetical protein
MRWQGPGHELTGSAAYVVTVCVQGLKRKTVLHEHPVHGLPEVGQSVEQRSVHVKNSSLEVHGEILLVAKYDKEKKSVPTGQIYASTSAFQRANLLKVIWKIKLDKVNFS